jgi:SAM-dependent methyltransferase
MHSQDTLEGNNISAAAVALRRWQTIMPNGYIGQQSFVSTDDFSGQLQRLATAKNCLDVGCGQGRMLVHLLNINKQLSGIGVDISSNDIQAAQAIAVFQGLGVRCQFQVADASGFDERYLTQFDSLIALDTVQSMPNALDFLKLVATSLATLTSVYVSMWTTSSSVEGQRIAALWGFPRTLSSDDVSAAWRSYGCRDNSIGDTTSKFRSYCERSAQSLVMVRVEFERLFGREAYSARLALEEATVAAVRNGHLRHLTIRAP